MRLNSVLVASFFASLAVVLAVPGREHRWSANATPDSNWAGRILTLEGNGTFRYVSSTVHAPNITGQKVGSSGVALVGIDGTAACLGGMLQLGVMFTVATEGPSYLAGYRYGNESEGFFPDVYIAAGDAIKLTVSAPVNATLGFVKVENLSNNQNATQQFNSTGRLCGKTAEWVVESLVKEDPQSPLVNFGTLTFADTLAGGIDDLGPQNSSIVNITQNGVVFASARVDNDSVIVTYL